MGNAFAKGYVLPITISKWHNVKQLKCRYSYLLVLFAKMNYNKENAGRWWYLLDYVTAKEMAQRWGLTTRRVQVLCEQGKIAGVTRLGKVWAIPCDAQKPADGRFQKSRGGLEDGK